MNGIVTGKVEKAGKIFKEVINLDLHSPDAGNTDAPLFTAPNAYKGNMNYYIEVIDNNGISFYLRMDLIEEDYENTLNGKQLLIIREKNTNRLMFIKIIFILSYFGVSGLVIEPFYSYPNTIGGDLYRCVHSIKIGTFE